MAGRTPGRKSALTRRLKERLFGLLRAGIPLTVACPGAGIDVRTYQIWRKRARDGEQRFVEFSQEADSAIACGRTTLLLQIRKHGNKDFRAPAWILEHAHAEEFSAKSQVEIKYKEGLEQLLRVAERVLPANYYAILLEAVTADDAATTGSGAAGGDQV